jgi:hypothetical protein
MAFAALATRKPTGGPAGGPGERRGMETMIDLERFDVERCSSWGRAVGTGTERT